MDWILVVDESRENYLFLTDLFEFDGDYHTLPSDFPQVYLNENNELEPIEYEMLPCDDIIFEQDIFINMTGEDYE